MTLKYIGVPETYSATIMAVESNVVQVSGPSLTMHESGFTITDDNGNEFDYTAFSTLYRTIEQGTYQYSNDGAVYTEPTKTVTVKIEWDDDEESASVRPANVKVQVVDGTHSLGTVTLNAKNNWSKVYEDVPVSHEYTVGAPDIDRYDKVIDGTLITYELQSPYEPTIEDQISIILEAIAELDERVHALEE